MTALASISSVRPAKRTISGAPRHLRLAADAIRVLHPGIALAVAFANLDCRPAAPTSRLPHRSGPVAAQGVDFGVKRRGRPHDRIGDKAESHGSCAARHACEQAGQRAGGRKLGAVDQRQPFLGAKHIGSARPCQGLGAGHPLPQIPPRPRRSLQRPYAPAGPDRPRPRPTLAGITGMTPLWPASLRSARRSRRTPDAPRPSDSSFRAIIRRARRGQRRRPRRSNATGSGCAAAFPCPAVRS